MKSIEVLLVLGAVFVLTSCSQGLFEPSFSGNLLPNTGSNSSQNLTNPYTDQALTLLQTHCSSCHGSTGGSGNVYGLTNISHLISSGLIVPGQPDQSLLYNSIVSNSMPPGSPLTNAEKQLIRSWIATTDSGSTSPAPDPVPAPAPIPNPAPAPTPTNPNATFASISATILKVSCTNCHSGMKTYTGTMKYVTAGNPNASSLYNDIYSGSMPRGSGKLNQAQIQAIQDWILDGAKNN